MQLTRYTDYAVRVLLYAAARPDVRCTCEEIAVAFGISRHHLVKVINGLQHLGYLETHRGRSGGFRLALPAEQIRLGTVVRQTEGPLAIVECFDRDSDRCPLTPACGLRGALREATDAFLEVLDRYTLADLVREPRWLSRLVALRPARAGAETRHRAVD
ncbi:MAG TPA: Rrf2 family transcriptional regulator [Vicinamibacterales bacterium]